MFVFGFGLVDVCDWIFYFGLFIVMLLDLFDGVFFLELKVLDFFGWDKLFFLVVRLVLEVKLEFVGCNKVFIVVVFFYFFFGGCGCFLCDVGLVVFVFGVLDWLGNIFNVFWVVFWIECVWINIDESYFVKLYINLIGGYYIRMERY